MRITIEYCDKNRDNLFALAKTILQDVELNESIVKNFVNLINEDLQDCYILALIKYYNLSDSVVIPDIPEEEYYRLRAKALRMLRHPTRIKRIFAE